MSKHTPTLTPTAAAHTPPALRDGGLLRGSLALALIAVFGFGLLYSLAGVGLGQALFPQGANGSLIERHGSVRGSALVAQPFADARYFQPRPSAAAYDTLALSGSNQARSNPALRQRLDEAQAAVAQREGVEPSAIPSELITQSGSGIDPHLTPVAAAMQVERVARARGLSRAEVEAVLARHTEPRQWGLLGQARVNVLALNLALDR